MSPVQPLPRATPSQAYSREKVEYTLARYAAIASPEAASGIILGRGASAKDLRTLARLLIWDMVQVFGLSSTLDLIRSIPARSVAPRDRGLDGAAASSSSPHGCGPTNLAIPAAAKELTE